MNNGSIKWDTFWDVQRFFIVNGETIKYQFGPEFITGTDEQGNEIKNLVRPAAKGEFPRPELAKSDAQFEEIFARELAREKINDPSVSISEVLSELDLAMVFFNDVLIRASLENINEQAYKEMRRIVSRFTNFIKSKNSNPTDDAERLPAKSTNLWGLTEAEIEKILETIIPADRESARLIFTEQNPKGRACMTKPFLIYAVGRLIAEKRLSVSNGEAIDFLHNHFTKKDGNPYSKGSLLRYFQDADREKMGPLKAIFFGGR